MHTRIIVKLAVALVHVQVAVRSVESRFTGASVAVPQGGTRSSVPAGLAGTVVTLFAGGTYNLKMVKNNPPPSKRKYKGNIFV